MTNDLFISFLEINRSLVEQMMRLEESSIFHFQRSFILFVNTMSCFYWDVNLQTLSIYLLRKFCTFPFLGFFLKISRFAKKYFYFQLSTFSNYYIFFVKASNYNQVNIWLIFMQYVISYFQLMLWASHSLRLNKW